MSQYPPNLIVLYINIELESIFQPYTLIKSVQPTTSSHDTLKKLIFNQSSDLQNKISLMKNITIYNTIIFLPNVCSKLLIYK